MRDFAHILKTVARYALVIMIFVNQSITFSQSNKNQHSPSGGPGINHVKGKCKPARAVTGYYFQARKIRKGKYVLSRHYRSSGITGKCQCWDGPTKSMSNFSLFSLDTSQMLIVRDSVLFLKSANVPPYVGIKHGKAMVPDTLAISKKSFTLLDFQKVWFDSIPKINSDW